MKLWPPKNDKDEYLKLIINGYGGDVCLVVVNNRGDILDDGYILEINSSGKLVLFAGIDIPGIITSIGGVISIQNNRFPQPQCGISNL